jgi:propionaldehyde dehydrogenase
MGKMPDKADKLRLVTTKTPGIEDVKPRVYTGDHGLVLEERAPYRVIGAITPSTNPASTVLSNGLCALAGGNTMVFNPHPAAKNVTLKTVEILNKAAVEVGGPQNLLTSIKEPTQKTSEKLMNHKNINLLVATGGEFMVGLAMHSGKKAIVGGPGNPPCMKNHKVYEIAESDIERITKLIIAKDEGTGYRVPIINKKYVGKAPYIILKDAGIDISEDTILAIMQVEWDHPLVQVEQLLPILPIVRVNDWKEAVERAIETEHHYRHTFTMHSTNIDRLSYMAKKCDASIFVKNGMSLQGLGYMGEGPTSMTIATPTGEGITTPVTFTRIRRCALVDRFRIV